MFDGIMSNRVLAPYQPDAEMVIHRLNEAGKTLLALPARGTRPGAYGNGWPDVVHEAQLAYGYNKEMPRPAVPSAQSITRMDQAFTWLMHIPDDRKRHRRIVLLRSLVHPITERHSWSWRQIGTAFGWSHEAVRMWYAQGIDWIVDGLKIENASAVKISVDEVDIGSAIKRQDVAWRVRR